MHKFPVFISKVISLGVYEDFYLVWDEDVGADLPTVQTLWCVWALTLLGPQRHICTNTKLFQKSN